MRTIIPIFLFIFFSPLDMVAQSDSNNWYFGFGAGLHFNRDGTVETIYDGQTRASEGVSSISSADGELLFYTDGGTVYNRNHDIMTNGDNLFGTEASTQSSLIVPLPQNTDRYYIFTIDATSPQGIRGRGLNYSIVDMSRDNGNGAVVEKNTNLLRDCTEKIAAIIGDCLEETVWIVTIATPTGAWNPTPPFPVFNTYHAFKMDSGGVSQTSVKSTFSVNTQFDQGYLKFSPDGTKLANAHVSDGLFLSDFDKNTGIVSNLELIEVTGTSSVDPYGVEFSPNGQFLYAHTFRKRPGVDIFDSALLQYDILAADISGSQVILEERDLFRGALQLGSNGKIYRTLTTNFTNDYVGGTPIENGMSYLGVINNPNEKGTSCDYQHNAIEIQGNRVRQGLPPLVQSLYTDINLAEIDDTFVNNNLAKCIGEPLIIEVQNIPGAIYTWTKDNNALTTAQTNRIEIASATAADAGNYNITITRPNFVECPVNGEISIMVYEKPITADVAITVCDMGDVDAFDGRTETDLERFFIDSDLNYSFYSGIADVLSETPIADPNTYTNIVPFEETIYYKATNMAGCESLGTLTLIVREVPILNMEETYFLCTDQPNLVITGPDEFDTYTWLRVDGGEREIISIEKEFNVLSEGNYILEAGLVINNIGVETNCTTSTTFEVFPSNNALIDEIRVERFTDNDTEVEILVTGDGDYEFSADGNTYQDSNIFENIEQGTVNFAVRDKNGCGVVSETLDIEPDESLGFPIFFTPNNDGINDFWQVLPPPKGEEMDVQIIQIFNRNGSLLTQINPNSTGWDGNFNGRPLPSSNYWFRATKLNGERINGYFALKR